MNTFRLKITGVAVLVVVAIIGVCIFWPGQTPTVESKDTEVQKEQKRHPWAEDRATIAIDSNLPHAERLFRTASLNVRLVTHYYYGLVDLRSGGGEIKLPAAG